MTPEGTALPGHAEGKPLSRTQIKYIAAALMLMDHIAELVAGSFPLSSGGVTLYYLVRTLGRITAPVMAFFIAEGCRHTRNVKKYILRLAVFALISAVPFRLFESGTALPFAVLEGNASARNACVIYFTDLNSTFVWYRGSVMVTLLLGLLSIILWDRARMNAAFKVLLTAVICWLAGLYDWSWWLVLYCLAFYAAGERELLKWTLFAAVSLLYAFNIKFDPFTLAVTPVFQAYRLGTLLVIPLIALCCNGSSGGRSGMSKWFFYVFYPVHLLILYFIRSAVAK